MRTHPLSFLLVLVAALFASCSDYTDKFDNTGNNGSLLIGTGGGLIIAPSGPIGGAALSVPAGALTDTVLITASEGQVVAEPGWIDVGPAVAWAPAGLGFAVPATMTLPFDPSRIPAGIPDGALRVKFVDENGALQTLVPTSVDRATGLVTLPVSSLGTFWVAAPIVDPDATTADLRDYLPLTIGDRYEFDTGLVIDVEPGIRNDPSLAYVDQNLGILRVESTLFQNDGTLITNGWTGSIYQFEFHSPLVRAPAMPTFGDRFTSSAPWTLTIPPGSANPVFTGTTDLIGEVTRIDPAEALATTGYGDVLQVATERTWSVDGFGVFEVELDFLWLARGIGPVLFEDSTGVRSVITGATVGGQPITP